jgi:2-iminobutanoate/2-iminopropanoate deaminase
MLRSIAGVVALSLVSSPLLAQQPAAPAGPVTDGPRTVFAPGGNLSSAIRVGDMVYASGQLGMSRQNPDTTIQGQTRLALESTKRVLESAGTTLGNAVKCTVFLTRVTDFQGMNQVYREFFPANPPARSTVVVAALVVPNAIVEIECQAAMPK